MLTPPPVIPVTLLVAMYYCELLLPELHIVRDLYHPKVDATISVVDPWLNHADRG